MTDDRITDEVSGPAPASSAELTDERTDRLVSRLFLVVWVFLLVRTAWLCDDAFITFRTVRNAIHLDGLVYNLDERVWSYTHTLWMLILSAASMITREVPYTALVISIAISALAAWVLAFRVASEVGSAVLALLVMFFSRPFLDYSTAGLENPLTHLLLALMMVAWLRPERDRAWLLRLFLIGGAGLLTRHDLLLVFGPVMAAGLIQCQGERPAKLRIAALGLLPLIIWELFALLYYGAVVPNTGLAKLGSGIPAGESLSQGITYYLFSLDWDPLGTLVIVSGLLLACTRPFLHLLPFAIGSALYLLYVLKIGGGFMAGRFLTPSIMVSLLILSRVPLTLRSPGFVAAAAIFALLGLAAPKPVTTINRTYRLVQGRQLPEHGIVDERGWYSPDTALTRKRRGRLRAANEDFGTSMFDYLKMKTVVHNVVGIDAFYLDRDVHMIDYWALADPLLARLPARRDKEWRIGHFERVLPIGYRETVETGEDRFVDRELAEYYSRLKLMVSGPLLSLERLKEIVRFNLGLNEHLVDLRTYRQPPQSVREYSEKETWLSFRVALSRIGRSVEGTPGAVRIPLAGGRITGLQIDLEDLRNDEELVLVSQPWEMGILFLREGRIVSSMPVGTLDPAGPGLVRRKFSIPERAAETGYDEIRLVARRYAVVVESLTLIPRAEAE